jgi:hypothetical protein
MNSIKIPGFLWALALQAISCRSELQLRHRHSLYQHVGAKATYKDFPPCQAKVVFSF